MDSHLTAFTVQDISQWVESTKFLMSSISRLQNKYVLKKATVYKKLLGLPKKQVIRESSSHILKSF